MSFRACLVRGRLLYSIVCMALINGAANGQRWLCFVSHYTKSQVPPPNYTLWTRRRHLSFYLICVTRKSCPTAAPTFLQRASTHWHIQHMMSSWHHRCHKLIVTRQSSVWWQSTSQLDLYYLPVKRPIYSQTNYFILHLILRFLSNIPLWLID